MINEFISLEPVAWSLRGCLLLGGALCVYAVCRRRSAAWRSFVWRVVMGALAATVGVTTLRWTPLTDSDWKTAAKAEAERISTETGDSWARSEEGLAELEAEDGFLDPRPALAGAPSVRFMEDGAAQSGRVISLSAVARAVWMVWGLGALMVLLRWGVSVWRRQQLERGADKLDGDESWARLVREVVGEGVTIRLLRHPQAVVPCAWGLWSPTIVLPAGADSWPLDHQRLALAHEWAHLQRRDPVWQVVSVVVLALHWANPLVWLAIRHWRLAEEEAADDAALRHAEPSRYAALLVDCARTLQTRASLLSAAVSMAHPSTVPQRVDRVLDASRDRRSVNTVTKLLTTSLGAAGVILITGLTSNMVAEEPPPLPPAEARTSPAGDRPSASTEESPPAAPQSYDEKLRTLVLPAMVLEEATLEEAVDFLRLKSVELDVAAQDVRHRGVNFILRLSAETTRPKVTLNLVNVPLGIAVKAVSDQAGVRSRVEPFAVIISDHQNDNELYTKTWRVPPDFLSMGGSGAPDSNAGGADPLAAGGGENEGGSALRPRASAIDILKQAGIQFPESGTAFFSSATSTLTVRNTPANLDLVDQFIESISRRLPKMINLRAELYRLPKAEALAVAESLDDTLDATEVVKKLRTQASGSEAVKLLAAPSLQTRSGQRARVQSGRGLPVDAPTGASADVFDTKRRRLEAEGQPAGAIPTSPGALPADFQGCLLEADPTLGADGFTLDAATSITYGAPPRVAGERPHISTLSTTTTLYVGQMRLLGMLSSGEDEETMTLVFLKAGLASYR